MLWWIFCQVWTTIAGSIFTAISNCNIYIEAYITLFYIRQINKDVDVEQAARMKM